ncbi:YggS family pyridoxal phosphate-dependent enzyme [Abiotrophia defectiva]|uniref:YggS family pyridoxal phosphate-dependent enzyme n=1 Tax=Abiotrophia defectiva TaxID=46125 RepID=UPI002282AC40|nr:YggS family pyridoxal phosphate-dependent enzyme [Abiotrophia defectiva]MCY7225594.1 YggS family pyridoxal phosphate-dependent enzyme [Abiotrophia defectiva]
MTQKFIQDRYQAVLDRIQKHSPEGKQPQLVAVSKTVGADRIQALYDLGQRHFGENRYLALLEKQSALAQTAPDIVWHFIGRVQTRQVKEFINQIDYLHALDRFDLAKEIQKRADHPIKCFLQVNVSGEESKTGYEPEQVFAAIEQLAPYDKIEIVGLMTMAPADALEGELHFFFKTLKHLQLLVQEAGYPHAPCTELSMGMSQDYTIATEEGASFLRVGSALFAPQGY